jgi:hypothetical protein
MKSKSQTQTVNNTSWTPDQIKGFGYIGRTVNKWRGRSVALYNHPSDPARVISIGVTFDGDVVVIADESRSDWCMALAAISEGRVLTTE